LGDIALLEPSFEEYYSHDMRLGAAPSIEHTDQIHTELLDLVPISSPFLPTTPTYLHAFQESLGDISGFHSSFDLYCAHLEDSPRKIMWSTVFDHHSNFSMAFDKFKRAQTLFAISLLVFSYLHHFKMHAKAYDKLL